MNILVATDFSTPAQHAVDLAAALAQRLGDRLVVGFAQEPPVVTSPDFAVDVHALERAVAEKAELRLRKIVDDLAARGIAAEPRIVSGMAVEALTRLGKDLDARFIVAGSHGRGAVTRFFVGSVAERLMLHADRPVLVTRKEGDEGLMAWARGQRLLHVAVALDMSSASGLGLAWVKELRRRIPCDITFLHFYWPPEQLSRLGITTAEALEDADPKTVSVLLRDLQAFVGELPGEGAVNYKIEANWGELGSHLAFAAADVDADLLIMGTHQRHGLKRLWLGSTVQPTLHAAIVPVLCVPGTSEVQPAATVPRMRQVLVATDFSMLGNAAVPYAFSIVENGGTVHLVHVHERHLPNPIYAYDHPQPKSLSGSQAETEFKNALLKLVPQPSAKEVHTQVHVVDGGRPQSAILQLATRLGVDAICVASHGRTGLGRALMGSVTQSLLEGADRPVFVMRGRRP